MRNKKITVYIQKKELRLLNEMYATSVLLENKKSKSSIVSEGIRLMHKNMFKNK